VFERLYHASDIVVDEADEAVISGDRLARLFLVEGFIVNLTRAHRIDEGMMWTLRLRVIEWQRHFVLRIEVVPFWSRNQRKVRAHERNKKHPRLTVGILRA